MAVHSSSPNVRFEENNRVGSEAMLYGLSLVLMVHLMFRYLFRSLWGAQISMGKVESRSKRDVQAEGAMSPLLSPDPALCRTDKEIVSFEMTADFDAVFSGGLIPRQNFCLPGLILIAACPRLADNSSELLEGGSGFRATSRGLRRNRVKSGQI